MPALPTFTDSQIRSAAARFGLLDGYPTPELTPALRNDVKRRLIAEDAPPSPSTARTLAALHRELLNEELPEPLAAAIVLEAARLEVRRLRLAEPSHPTK